MQIQDFEKYSQDSFQLKGGSDIETVTIKELKRLEKESDNRFSVLFESAQKERHFPQQVMEVIWPDGERKEMVFLVPLGPGENGMLYEAIFN